MKKIVMLAAVGIAPVLIAGCSGSTKTVETTVTATATVTPAPVKVTVTATPVINKVVATKTKTHTETYTPTPDHTITDGLYKVGEDVNAGEYKTDGGECYYALLSSTNTDDIIDNNNIEGPARVTLSGGQYFETDGGCEWESVASH